MFFFLSKTIDFLASPAVWIATCLLLGLLLKNLKIKKWLLWAGFALFMFFTNDFLCNEATHAWEWQASPFPTKTYDAAIVLTGITMRQHPPHDRLYFNKGADRATMALDLFKRGMVRRLIVTGGNVDVFGKKNSPLSEAEELRRFWLMAGVPDSCIWVEDSARNTRENALYTHKLLKKKGRVSGDYLLITSAFHMKRSMGCFEKAGLSPTPFAVDFYGETRQFTPAKLFLPRELALHKWDILIHEWVGYITYRILGYA